MEDTEKLDRCTCEMPYWTIEDMDNCVVCKKLLPLRENAPVPKPLNFPNKERNVSELKNMVELMYDDISYLSNVIRHEDRMKDKSVVETITSILGRISVISSAAKATLFLEGR